MYGRMEAIRLLNSFFDPTTPSLRLSLRNNLKERTCSLCRDVYYRIIYNGKKENLPICDNEVSSVMVIN